MSVKNIKLKQINSKYKNRLFLSSFSALISIYSAFHNKLYYAYLRSIIVLFTSLLYWYHPTDGIRRKMDMICVNTFSLFQLFYTANYLSFTAWLLYICNTTMCLVFYMIARYFGRKKNPNYNISSIFHILLHLFGNIGNIILFDGVGLNYFGTKIN